MSKTKNKTAKVFLVRNTEDKDTDFHYWEQFNNLEDAVSDSTALAPVEVYEAVPKLLGYYESRHGVKKVKAPKAKPEPKDE